MKNFYYRSIAISLCLFFFSLFLSAQNVNTSTAGNGTSTVPANAVSATVQIWGAGGAGGGSRDDGEEGAGGGGGGYSTRTFVVAQGQTINYIVGLPGNGSTGNGNSGGYSSIIHTNSSTSMTAYGGTGGDGNNDEDSLGIGIGGTAIGGTSNIPGQNGGPGHYVNGTGSTGGNGGNGGNAPGTGGAGRNDNNGVSGTIPGGGGGGAESVYGSNRSGGNGANGRVIITYTIVLTPTITAYTPNPVCVGQSVTITGTNFTGATAVRFNGVNATSYTVNSGTQITAVVPATTNGTITVVTPGGTATSVGSITINSLSTAPTSITGTTTICNGNSTLLTLNGGIAGTGAVSQWYTDSCGGTPVSGTGNTRMVTPTATTTYFVRYSGTCNTTTCAQITVTVENPVAAAGTITGTTPVCQGDTGIVYSVPAIANATSYTWSLPLGASIVSGANTNSITVNYNASATAGDVSVFGSNTCGDGTTSTLPITVNNLPLAAGPITGTASVCPGDTNVSFSIPAITDATSYTWSLPAGASINSGAGTENITVDFSLAASSGTISVVGANTCGDGTAANFSVTVSPLPAAAGIISGTSAVCPGDSGVIFSVSNITNATGYIWTLPAGATIMAGNNTNSITVDFSNSATSGNITVQGTNACGVGTVSSNFSLTINTESIAPTSILGTTTICESASTTLTLDGGLAGTGATAEWFSGSCGGASEGTGNSIVVSPIVTTTYFVRYNGTCNTTSCAQVTVNVDPLPLAAGTITGPSAVCQGNTGITFTVPIILNATDYIWTLPSGATIASGANTNSIVVDFDITASSGNITVQGSNACGTGAVSTFPITVNITPYIPTNYTIDACSGVLSTLTPANGGGNVIPAGTTYSWGLPTVTGGITGATALTGQTNFNQTLVNPTNTDQTATYSVTAETAGCSASTFTVVVTVHAKPVGAAAPTSQTVCNGPNNTLINFSETSGVAGTITYSWTRDNDTNLTGLAASGFGSSVSGTLVNNTAHPQTTVFTVIAKSQYGCDSEPFTVSVTVKVTPTIAATPTSQTVCSENDNTSIALSIPVVIAGTPSYSWTRTNTTNITGLESGTISTATILGSLINTTLVPQTTTFTITSIVLGCPSAPTTVTVTVNPKPTIAVNLATQTVCGGTAIANIVTTNPNSLSGVTYSWTRDNTTNLTGIANSGTGNTISGTFVNNSAVDQTATFTIRANKGTCYTETTSEVIVRPTPLVVATPATQTLCNGITITPIVLSNTHNIPGTTYSWTRTNTTNVTGIAASGTGSSISGTLTNTRPNTQTVTFTIVATAPNGCSQTTTATVILYATLKAPVIGTSQDICGNFDWFPETPAPLSQTTSVSGGSGTYNYQWQSSTTGANPWNNIAGATNATFQPPTGVESFYRLIVSDANCASNVTSNAVVINYTGIGGVLGGASYTIPAGPFCSGSSVRPVVRISHSFLSDVRFTWSANSAYIVPSSGNINGNYSGGLFGNSSATLPLTVQNYTNSSITTQLYVTPTFNFLGGGTCNADALTINITILPVPVAEATVATSTFCAGTSADIAVTGNITDADMQFSWTRTNPSGIGGGGTSGTSGNISPGTIYTLNNNLTNSSGAPQNVTYTITPSSNGCSGAPITIMVTVAPDVTPGSIAANQTICYGNDPVAFTQVTAATGMNLTYQWQISTTSNSTGFTDIVGATSTTYDAPGPVTQDTWYRRIAISSVNSIVCNSLPSNVLMVTINNITAGTIGDDQTVCSGGNPGIIANMLPASGIGTRTYQWQFNIVGCGEPDSGWTNVGGNSATYDPPNGLLVTTYYRRKVTYTATGNSCSEVSNCVTVFVNDVTGGIIENDQTICGDNPDEFTVLTASTGTGVLSYQWQSRPGTSGAWNDITGATSATYDAPPGLAVTTSYRRMTFSTLNGVSCSALSNIVIVTANAVTPGIIAGNRTVCSGGNPAAFTVTTAATGPGLTYQWQSAAAAAGPYTDISGATSATYDVPAGITSTTYYQRVVTGNINGLACPVESNFLTVFVNDITPSVIAGDQVVCSTEDPAAFTVATAATGSGTVSYQWQSSTISATGPWTNINLETSATYNPPVLTQTTYYQVVVTSTLNGVACSEESNPLTVTVTPFVTAVASNTTPINDCSNTTIVLSGNLTGQWSAVAVTTGSTFSFSNVNDPGASFTGESGAIYDITWTVTNSPCADSPVNFQVAFPNCGNYIFFDGVDDSANFGNSYDLDSNFSIEIWVKRENFDTRKQSIISKRDGSSTASGYDLSFVNNQAVFSWNGASVTSTQTVNETRWYHIAVTSNGGTCNLYIDGILSASAGGSVPVTNSMNTLLGATARNSNSPIDFFEGSMDELRIWNTTLTEQQVRDMMNQEIEISGTNVRGSIIPENITGLTWANLDGYYQMNQSARFTGDTIDINSGTLLANVGVAGILRNMQDFQDETAPLPYVSSTAGGAWDNPASWLNGTVQQIPNTNGATWNIVQIAGDVSSNRVTTLNGLLINTGRTLSITDDQKIEINKYLFIDGTLDLEGESQLMQPTGSIVDNTGTGVLHRDQQGTANLFNYNYWSSPVSSSADGLTYKIGSVLYDGASPVLWTTAHNAIGTTTPVTMSSRWLYLYENYLYNSYYDWHKINETYDVNVGLGFIMKGSGRLASEQNYTFVGKPNNGTYTHPISSGGREALIGNPYPSALDAIAFINDNNAVLEDGTLRFWEQAPSNNSHVTTDYLGGYAYYNLLNHGMPAVSIPGTSGPGDAIKVPQQYIPVSQGFMVTAVAAGGTIEFNNDQRYFMTESIGNSIFLRQDSDNTANSTSANQLIEIDFFTPENAVRHLLLGFTPNIATEGIDYGYDAINNEYVPNDMSFAIEGEKFIIQGVGTFNEENTYPLVIDLATGGQIGIALKELINFDEAIDVYVYDSLLGIYHPINDTKFVINLEAGTYDGRFFLTFQEDQTLSNIDNEFKDITVKYLQGTNEIYISTPGSIHVKQVYMINIAGQVVKAWNSTNTTISHEMKIPVKDVSEGNYIIKIQTDTNNFNKKIIVKYK